MTALLEQTRVDARLTIDLGAVARNTGTITRLTPAAVMAVVKADGFGHGAEMLARTALAAGATWLGVTSLDEALALRDAKIAAPLLSWLNPVGADFGLAARRGVDVAVPSRQHLDAVVAAGGPVRVHLHLDTGMARDGAEPEAWAELCRSARRAEIAGRIQVVGVMGHLSCADEPAHPANAEESDRFVRGLAVARRAGLRPAVRHLAATAATLSRPSTHFDLVRIGAGLVGIDTGRSGALRPAMTLTAPVVSVRRVRAGTPVGYGRTWTAPTATSLALIPLGYADGLPRAASGRAEVLIGGRRRPLVGRISMDQAVADLGDDRVEPGTTATVFGPGDAGEPTVADWAGWTDSIENEIVTGLGSRVHRTFEQAGDQW